MNVNVPGVEKPWVAVTQRPRWQMPVGQAAPSGLFLLHLPRLRRLHGEQRFFFACEEAKAAMPELARAALSTARREEAAAHR